MPAAPARAPAPTHLPRRGTVRSARILLPDGARTTLHVALHDLARVEVRVAVFRARPLVAFCARRGVAEALVGGFFTRPDGVAAGRGPHARRAPPPRPLRRALGDVRAA